MGEKTRADWQRVAEEFQSERDAAKADALRAFDERNVALDELKLLRTTQVSARGKVLSSGQVDLIRRALRYYAHAEQDAVQAAVVKANQSRKKGDQEHARDVARQAKAHIEAAQALVEFLAPDFKKEKASGETKDHVE